MKNIRLKNKTIYMFAVVALICFCFLLFPVATKTVRADVISAGQCITIKSAYVQVKKDTNTGEGEWALMFNATIDKDNYNALTNFGKDNVRLGMLIGPTKDFASVTDYATAIKAEFVEFRHVGTASSGAFEYVKFASDVYTYTYSAGIRFNDEYLEKNEIDFMGAAKLELTVIPLYVIDGEPVAVVENAKSCIPRNVLTESFIKEQSSGINNIPINAVDNYAGKFTEATGDYYICKSTDRLMGSSVEGGDLTPMAANSGAQDKLFINNKLQPTSSSGTLDADLVKSMESGDKASITLYTADDKIFHYTACVAEKVITRFFNKDDIGTDLTLEDYFANGDTGYNIFYMSNAKQKKFPGLYVLANDITPKFGRKAARSATSLFTEQDYGFTGTFDGRGKVIDYNWLTNGTTALSSHSIGGIFPSATGATIKNFAVKNAVADPGNSNDHTQALVGYAYNTTFENIYFHFGPASAASEYNGASYNRALLIREAPGSIFNNVIIDCGYATDKSGYYSKPKYTQSATSTSTNPPHIFTRIYDEADPTKLIDVKITGSKYNSNDNCWGGFQNGLFGRGSGYNMTNIKSASNLFAVGGNTIFIFQNNTNAAFTNGLLPEEPKPNTTYITLTSYMVVSENPWYKDNVTGEIKECQPSVAYTLDEFDYKDSVWKDYLAPYYEYAEYYLMNKMGAWAELAFAQGQKVKIVFKSMDGLYDMRSATDFTNWVKNDANKDALAKFDSAYWNVDKTNGTVTWKGL